MEEKELPTAPPATMNLDGSKVEGEVKEAADLQIKPQFDPVESASQIFATFFPQYCRLLDKLSRKQIVRLNKALMAQPLEENMPNIKDPVELQAFLIGERLLQCKMVITHSVLTEKQKELEAKKNEVKHEQAG